MFICTECSKSINTMRFQIVSTCHGIKKKTPHILNFLSTNPACDKALLGAKICSRLYINGEMGLKKPVIRLSRSFRYRGPKAWNHKHVTLASPHKQKSQSAVLKHFNHTNTFM